MVKGDIPLHKATPAAAAVTAAADRGATSIFPAALVVQATPQAIRATELEELPEATPAMVVLEARGEAQETVPEAEAVVDSQMHPEEQAAAVAVADTLGK